MSKTPKAQSTLESIQLPKDRDDSLTSGSCEDSLIAEPHADQVDAIKASLNTEIHSVVTKATGVYANQPEALSSEVLLGTEGNGDDADHAVVGSLTPDYDLALVEGLDPGWHTALVLMETLVNPGNDPDLTVSDSSKVSLITDDLPVVDSAVDSRGQQRAEDDLQRTDKLLTRSCADFVTTEKHYAVPFDDSLNSDKEISLNIKDHDDRPTVDFSRDSVSSSDQSLSLVATALGSIVTVDSFNKALLVSNTLYQDKDNPPIDQPVVKSQTTENLINPTLVSESVQPLINEILEDNIISAPDDRPLFTTDHIGSREIEIFIFRMHLGSVITCHDDQFLESDSEDDMVDPLAHTRHSHHLCESVMRPKGQVQLSGHTWSPSYETNDCRRYAQDHNMMEYKFKYSWDLKSACVSVPHYILTRGESVTKRMEGEKKYGEKEWEKCSSQCDRNSLIEHNGQWRIARAVEAITEEILPKPYTRDLVMYDGFKQLNEERVGNQLSSLSAALNEVKKDKAFWRSLGINKLMKENERINGEMKKKDMRNFNSAKERRAERKRERRRERERNCDVTTWMPSRPGMESSIIGLRPRPPSRPLLREPLITRTSFSRTDARTIEVREMILQRSRIAYKIKCLQRRKAAAEGLTLTEGGGGPEDGGDGETVMDITGQSKKSSKGKGSKGKESEGGEGSDWGKLGLEEIVETDDRNKEKRTKVQTGQRSKDRRREERERQRCSKETDLISHELARMDIEKIDRHKEDETVSKISEEKISKNCCVETNEGEKDDRKQMKEKTNRSNVLTDEGVLSKASWEREEEAGEENAKTFQESLKVQEVIDGEEGTTGRKLEHQKARDSEEIRNSDGYVKMREIGKRKEVEVEVTKIGTACDEMSIMVLESQANARPMTDSQTPMKGKGKQKRNLPYKRTERLQEEINSKGEMLEGGRQVNFPECQAQKHRSPGELGDVAGFWRKEKRVHKEKDRECKEEKDRVGRTWRDQGGNGRDQWNGETERGGVGRSRRARQRGNQLLLFSRQKHSNWNDSHPSESSCDWRSREKEAPEKHVESRMDRQRGERPRKGEKS